MADNISSNSQLLAQWRNPGEIFSLLLLVGGDVVQKAIARLVGVRVGPSRMIPAVYLTPVAFSFGWIAYAFTALASVLGDHRLMPPPDTDIQVVNCDNGYMRNNNSWVLGRMVRDKESRVQELEKSFGSITNHPADSTGNVSLAIDLFVAEPVKEGGPRTDKTWWSCCFVVLLQQVIAVVPWVIYNDWSIFMITATGTILALSAAGLPQWSAEKWAKKVDKYTKNKTMALTRGNGHQYVMLILCPVGAWDLEAMASGRQREVSGTNLILSLFSFLWVVLLVTVTGLKEHTWFLVAVGGLGMLQNVTLAAKKTRPDDFNIKLRPYPPRPTITGYQSEWEVKKKLNEDHWHKDRYKEEHARRDYESRLDEGHVRDVMGALIELEKYHPKAGAALVPVFFPGSVDYSPGSLRAGREKVFWAFAEQKSAAISGKSPGSHSIVRVSRP